MFFGDTVYNAFHYHSGPFDSVMAPFYAREVHRSGDSGWSTLALTESIFISRLQYIVAFFWTPAAADTKSLEAFCMKRL